MEREEIEQKLANKVKSDTESEVNSFNKSRRVAIQRARERMVDSRVSIEAKSPKKKLESGQANEESFDVFDARGNLQIILILGSTVCLINDFVDVILFESPLMVSQVFDITNLFLMMLLLNFLSRSYFITVFVIIFSFILEIVPVLGVIPFWTIGIGIWYMRNRKR